MSARTGEPFVLLGKDPQISLAEVSQELASSWEQLRTSHQLRERLRAAGVDEQDLDDLLSRSSPPLQAEQEAAGFGVTETILISVAAGLARDAIVAIWKIVVWPRLESRFGADLEQKGDAGNGSLPR